MGPDAPRKGRAPRSSDLDAKALTASLHCPKGYFRLQKIASRNVLLHKLLLKYFKRTQLLSEFLSAPFEVAEDKSEGGETTFLSPYNAKKCRLSAS